MPHKDTRTSSPAIQLTHRWLYLCPYMRKHRASVHTQSHVPGCPPLCHTWPVLHCAEARKQPWQQHQHRQLTDHASQAAASQCHRAGQNRPGAPTRCMRALSDTGHPPAESHSTAQQHSTALPRAGQHRHIWHTRRPGAQRGWRAWAILIWTTTDWGQSTQGVLATNLHLCHSLDTTQHLWLFNHNSGAQQCLAALMMSARHPTRPVAADMWPAPSCEAPTVWSLWLLAVQHRTPGAAMPGGGTTPSSCCCSHLMRRTQHSTACRVSKHCKS